MGIGREYVFGALRVTFGLDNRPSDVDALLEVIPTLVVGAQPKIMVRA
jgi:cysteine sulfinate desulfinase/cysteine desulfurase-like protein